VRTDLKGSTGVESKIELIQDDQPIKVVFEREEASRVHKLKVNRKQTRPRKKRTGKKPNPKRRSS
jgi:hypothetical protein